MKLFPLHIIPNDTKFDVMRRRNLALIGMLVLLVASIGIIVGKGFHYALDFTGGTVIEARFAKPADIDQVRQRLIAAGFENAQVQNYGSASDLLIRLQPRTEGKSPSGPVDTETQNRVAQGVMQAIATPDNAATLQRNEFVGPQVGKELAWNGVYAAAFMLVGFLVYIAVRFELKFAIAASLTAVFDLLLTLAYMSLTGREFDLTVLAGLLSVMGFAINDIIVVFDRVRENFRVLRVDPLEVLNRSINQTLSRTIITGVMFFLSALALYIYGGGSLEGLALTHLVGAVVVILSSVLVACPLLSFGPLKVTKQDLLPKARDVEALARRP